MLSGFKKIYFLKKKIVCKIKNWSAFYLQPIFFNLFFVYSHYFSIFFLYQDKYKVDTEENAHIKRRCFTKKLQLTKYLKYG